MARCPRPGACKTRLCPPLTPDEAADLYVAFLEDISRELSEWSFEGDLWVAWSDDEGDAGGAGDDEAASDEAASGPAAHEVPEALRRCFDAPFRFLRQQGDSLADRMDQVFAQLFRGGYQQVVMRNSDSPHLPPSLLTSAFDALNHQRGSLALGPDLDGGYYLVGLDVPPDGLLPQTMSTNSVLDDTVRNAGERGLRVELLDSFLDIDTVDDLLTFWLEFGGRADVRHWSTWKLLNDSTLIERLGA